MLFFFLLHCGGGPNFASDKVRSLPDHITVRDLTVFSFGYKIMTMDPHHHQ
jgi:hypothetical protein